MITLPRVLLNRCNQITRTTSIFGALSVNEKLFCATQNLNVSTEAVNEYKRRSTFTNNKPIKRDGESGYRKPISPRFNQIMNEVSKMSNRHNVRRCGTVINKMLDIISDESYYSGLHSELTKFLKTHHFNNFCQSLEKNLLEVPLQTLITILLMEKLGVPAKSRLMRKVLTLILDNINGYTVVEKLAIYAVISRKFFENVEECQNLKKVFDVYFDSTFAIELNQWKVDGNELLEPLRNDNMPVKVKKIIADMVLDNCTEPNIAKSITKYIAVMYLRPNPLITREKVMETFTSVLKAAIFTLRCQLGAYRDIVSRDNSLYDEKLCDLIAFETRLSNADKQVLFTVHELCLMGHLDDDLLRIVADNTLILRPRELSVSKFAATNLCDLFARTCIHERDILEPENWEEIKRKLQSFINEVIIEEATSETIGLCYHLAFLGCDSSHLCNSIFSNLTNAKPSASDGKERELLLLHHIAKIYFPADFTGLSDEMLTELLMKTAATNTSFPSGLIDFVGGEDYLLMNCTTSDKHFLDYVAVLGPDNKPINLSTYKNQNEGLFNIEDIEKPSGSKIVVFQNFTDLQPIKYHNSPLMSGLARIFLKSFETLNGHVVLLPALFETYTPERKTEYLKAQLDDIDKRSV